jgi:hypothetical protein
MMASSLRVLSHQGSAYKEAVNFSSAQDACRQDLLNIFFVPAEKSHSDRQSGWICLVME